MGSPRETCYTPSPIRRGSPHPRQELRRRSSRCRRRSSVISVPGWPDHPIRASAPRLLWWSQYMQLVCVYVRLETSVRPRVHLRSRPFFENSAMDHSRRRPSPMGRAVSDKQFHIMPRTWVGNRLSSVQRGELCSVSWWRSFPICRIYVLRNDNGSGVTVPSIVVLQQEISPAVDSRNPKQTSSSVATLRFAIWYSTVRPSLALSTHPHHTSEARCWDTRPCERPTCSTICF